MAEDYGANAAPSEVADKAEKTEPSAKLNAYWREIARYDRATEQWRQDGEKIVDLYLQDQLGSGTETKTRRFPLLWANVETLKPAVYAKMPIVQCSRRFKDRDPIGRIAGEILERSANTTFDLYSIDEVLRMVRDDRLLPGRGTAWVRYEASFETVEEAGSSEGGAAAKPAVTGVGGGTENSESGYERLSGEKVCVDYVHWCDFGHGLARTWSDVPMVWRRVYKTREECEERFGEAIAEKLVYTMKAPDDKDETGHKACLYEIWDKKKRKVVWVAKEHPEIIEEGAPPLQFMGFYPTPEPCYATKTSKSLIPTADYLYYRHQAMEINDLTVKVASLTDWLKLQGFVPAAPSPEGADAIKNLVAQITNSDTLLIQVESWAAFIEKGGSKIIDWLPIQHVIVALKGAIEARAQLIQDVFQITGISDIIRGQTDPNETLGAQELKAQTGSRRLKNTRDEIVRFARDLSRLVCEVIAEQFQPETLAAMSGFKYMPPPQPGQIALPPPQAMQGGPPLSPVPGGPPQQMQAPPAMVPPNGMQMPGPMGAPPPQQAPGMAPPPPDAPEQAGVFGDEVIQLLRDDRLRSFRIDIETDSTVQADEDAEKQRAIEFLGAVGKFMTEAVPVLQAAPAMAPAMGEALMFLARRMRAGRQLEDTIERSVTQMTAQLQQQMQQPREDPKVIEARTKGEIDKKLAENQIGIQQQDAGNKRQIAQEDAANERNIKLLGAQNDMKIATMKGVQEVAHKERAASEDIKNKKAVASDDRTRKQIDHADDTKRKEEGASQELELKRKSVEAAPEIEAAKTLMEKLPDLVAATSEKMVATAMDKVEERVKAIKFPPRVRRPKYDNNGNIVEVREEDAA